MQNIFPIAEKPEIEETEGLNRTSAHPPEDQLTKTHMEDIYSIYFFPTKPKWFSKVTMSEIEKNIFESINNNLYLTIRNKIIDYYESEKVYVSLSKVLEIFENPLQINSYDEKNEIKKDFNNITINDNLNSNNLNNDNLNNNNSLNDVCKSSSIGEDNENSNTYTNISISQLSTTNNSDINKNISNFLKINNNLLVSIFDFLEDKKIINLESELGSAIFELDSIYEKYGLKPVVENKEDLNSVKDNLTNYYCSTNNNNYSNNNVKNNAMNLNEINHDYNNSNVYDSSKNAFNDIKFDVKESYKVKTKYLKKEHLVNSYCKCSKKAEFFTSTLFFICKECLDKGFFPQNFSVRNFHKITSDLLQAIWTKQEEYILLKNLEIYGDDWSRVCQGINKSHEQCIFHFIKMSILDDISIFPKIPFLQVPNPVSTFISFVCSMVYPSISTELARVAIKNLNSPNLMEILIKISISKGMEVLELEKRKIMKIHKVEIEALTKSIMLKIDAINEMRAEISLVKQELEDEREKYMH